MSDELVKALEEFVEDREGSVADQTFRALMHQRMEGLEKQLERVAGRQDAMLLLIVGAVIANLALPFLRGG